MSNLEASNLFSVKDLVVVITGGGTGIGLMMAKALDANGAKVYVIGRRKEPLEAAAKQAKNQNIHPLVGDITSQSSLSSLASEISSQNPYINVLIANAGTSGPRFPPLAPQPPLAQYAASLWETPPADFTETFAVNTTAAFYTLLAFLPLLDAGNKSGKFDQKSQFIATASIGAYNRRPLSSYAYGPSKAATVHMVKQIATMFAPYQIRANVIAPGLYPSEMTSDIFAEIDGWEEGSMPPEQIPAKRAGREEDMAGVVLFLCSKAGAYLDGNVVVSDGGRLGVVPSTY
ncbi:short chain dehydrogenase reductase [Lasallia pustulata]|uniref:Short chain dehydrogenase reductase n=1 Tax=Lasallia pustulata TaxID=136370 RepID=A0A1W5D175_9LECA|nr:short chain dehydrogenase reductase [Lasallia pustulata]